MLINETEQDLFISEQCILLSISRSTFYYEALPAYGEEDLRILQMMDELFTDYPFYEHRRIHQELLRQGFEIGRDRVLKYMQVLGLDPFYPHPRTSVPSPEHKVYPYLLKDLAIVRPNQVWAIDITYVRMLRGFCYLVAIIDWYSRYLLSYQISNSLDKAFCLEALETALKKYPSPEVHNSDQGSQFTSEAFTGMLLTAGILISMDSRGRALDNVIIERFFRTLKHEHVYLIGYETIPELKSGVADFIHFYNHKRLHSTLGYATPFEVYAGRKEVNGKGIQMIQNG